MDTAVALVNAYLHINGYFTVTEYQVIESHSNGARARTDLDILAVRFPGAGRLVFWDFIRASEFKDPAFGLLVVLEKAMGEHDAQHPASQ